MTDNDSDLYQNDVDIENERLFDSEVIRGDYDLLALDRILKSVLA